MTQWDTLTVYSTILISLTMFATAKFHQYFRIMRRSYIDDIERRAQFAEGRIEFLERQLAMQYNNELVKETVAPGITQLSFNLPSTNQRTFRFPFSTIDPDTKEKREYFITGRWSDWVAWQAGKRYIKRRGQKQWVNDDEVNINDQTLVVRKTWDKRARAWYDKIVWIYADEKTALDQDIGPFELEG